MIVKTRHFGIIVKDIQVSTNFYSKILGLDMKSELLENGNYLIYTFGNGLNVTEPSFSGSS